MGEEMPHHLAKRKLSFVQNHAYYKAFLQALDSSHYEVNNWEAKFIESNLDHVGCFSQSQEQVIARMMEKYLHVKPRSSLYETEEAAHAFLYPGRVSDDHLRGLGKKPENGTRPAGT